MCLVYDCEVAYLHIISTDNLLRQLLVDVVELRDDEVHDCLCNRAVLGERIHLDDEALVGKVYLIAIGKQFVADKLFED